METWKDFELTRLLLLFNQNVLKTMFCMGSRKRRIMLLVGEFCPNQCFIKWSPFIIASRLWTRVLT